MLRSISISLFLSLILCSCVDKSDIYGDDNGEGSVVDSVSIAYLKTLYRGYPLVVSIDSEIRGVVTANDRFGALSNCIFISDASGGIEVKISGDELYALFTVGRRVAVRIQGLTLGDYGGVVSLGAASDNPKYENGYIPNAQMAQFFRPLSGFTTIDAKKYTVSTLEPKSVGDLIHLQDVQFIDEQLNLNWSDYDANSMRHLVDKQGDTLLVYVDRRSQFAGDLLPTGSGYIRGILSYFNRSYQFLVVNPKEVVMKSPRF